MYYVRFTDLLDPRESLKNLKVHESIISDLVALKVEVSCYFPDMQYRTYIFAIFLCQRQMFSGNREQIIKPSDIFDFVYC